MQPECLSFSNVSQLSEQSVPHYSTEGWTDNSAQSLQSFPIFVCYCLKQTILFKYNCNISTHDKNTREGVDPAVGTDTRSVELKSNIQ